MQGGRIFTHPSWWSARRIGYRRAVNETTPGRAELYRIIERLVAENEQLRADATRHDARWRYRLRLEAAGLRDGSGQWHSASREEIRST